MKVIRFRRLTAPNQVVQGIQIARWEIAFNQVDLDRKLNGEVAEVIMPAKPWPVRLWRRLFPLRGIETKLGQMGD